MNSDEICELLLRLPPGGALMLPPEVERMTVEHAIQKAAERHATARFAVSEHLSSATSFKPARRYLHINRLGERSLG